MNRITTIPKKVKNALIISDLHLPYHHRHAFQFLEAAAARINPDIIICIGDEVDYHALSRFEKDPDLYSGGDEFAWACKLLDLLEKLFPVVHFVRSNHGARYVKSATLKAGIPRAMLKTECELYKKPNWTWDNSLNLISGGRQIRCVHGAAANAATYAAQCGHSIIQGHYHNYLTINWTNTHYLQLFSMTVGCLVDKSSYAMAYSRDDKFGQMLGTGALIDGEPYLLRMGLNKLNQWDRKIRLGR